MAEKFQVPALTGKTARYAAVSLGLAGAAWMVASRKRVPATPPAQPFLLDFIEQSHNTIRFSWPDIGDSYKVYRDGREIYTGDFPSVSDKGLLPGNLYSYLLDCLSKEGKSIKRIKVQTSTAVHQKGTENILANSVFTTIVSDGLISLEWGALEGITDYSVYRDNVRLAKINECQFIDQDFDESLPHIYTIRASRPLEQSEEGVSEGKSVVARLVGLARPGLKPKDPAMERFEITCKIAPVKDLLADSPQEGELDPAQIRYTTFLPQKTLKNPNSASKYHYFAGDGRTFQPNSDKFRTRAEIIVDKKMEPEPVRLKKETGITKAYNWMRKPSRKEKADDEGIKLEKITSTNEKISFQLIHSVGNPVVISPAIDYEVDASFYRTGEVDISGRHDQAPNHEVYIRNGDGWEPVHLSNSKGLEMMAPPTADKQWRYITLTR